MIISKAIQELIFPSFLLELLPKINNPQVGALIYHQIVDQHDRMKK
jgi:hypothetical protein